MLFLTISYITRSMEIAMHSPLGLTLDNIFFRALEQWFLSNCPAEFQPLLYRRYVDDTCCIFKNSKQIGRCLEYLNSQHPKVKFTHDVEEDGSLAFLDVLVIHDHKGYTTNLYLKTTFTGLYTNFNSLSPNQYKNNLITALSEQPHYKYNLNIRTISISEQSQYKNNLITALLYRVFHICSTCTCFVHKWGWKLLLSFAALNLFKVAMKNSIKT